ncbi:peptide/nickel transport system permease protein [Pseudoscardovia suis]|uniref:ABC transporter permease n=2 Tax=Pseudoscardovia suis TaxID=987063 RepID=A0A261F1M1_9BIFI|nr:ABC transporter permease [Pseudoscardovia suis]PJJ68526.1 peptide/nickel transport system permease protein [Pseudoscardovia suis]
MNSSIRLFVRRTGIILRSMWHRADGAYALAVLMAWLVVCAVSMFWTPYGLLYSDAHNVWDGPSAAHPLGTDGAGHDLLTWLMKGSVTQLGIVVLVVACTTVLGLLGVWASVGSHAGAGRGSRIWMVCVDTLIAVPTVLVAMLVSVPLGSSIAVIVIACSFAYALSMVRVTRPVAQLAAASPYVAASRSYGVGEGRIFFSHVVPAIAPMMAVQLSMSAGTAILAESGLTYLGIGVPAGVPSWGRSLATCAKLITVHPLTVIWPGLIITAVVVALNLLGDALRDCADPLVNADLRRVSYADAVAADGHAADGRADNRPDGHDVSARIEEAS